MEDLKAWNEAAAKSFDSNQLDEMVKDLHRVGKLYEEAEKQKKELGKMWDDQQAKVLKILQDAKKSQYSVDGVGMVYTKNKLVVTTPKTLEDKRAFKQYCLEKYGPEFVDDKFNMLSVSLTSFFNTEMENSKDPSFHIAGLQSPTQVTTLAFKGEVK